MKVAELFEVEDLDAMMDKHGDPDKDMLKDLRAIKAAYRGPGKMQIREFDKDHGVGFYFLDVVDGDDAFNVTFDHLSGHTYNVETGTDSDEADIRHHEEIASMITDWMDYYQENYGGENRNKTSREAKIVE